ncbi:DotU family type IV/VI secretion system protein [Pandoraea communis]|uniref:DotU family type IV/VI secretion system protein n=1 Tax=Pandoraea communis TaxID=2508297 RepID=UPI0025A62398|nr:DotU family type IV/VI secretion system protein [Pandoraea communis]MDM8359309.1 DotU family type IV/VI secretion system protein [Pandoraea communis]
MNSVVIDFPDPAAAGHTGSLAVAGYVAPQFPIRPLLSDTALLVATVRAGGLVEDPAVFREKCETLLEAFDVRLAQAGIDGQLARDFLMAQCALLDETALHYLKASDRGQWEAAPLQVTRFGIHDAGERVFERLDAHMQAAGTSVDVLEFYQGLLSLGFVGRYALLGEAMRRDLIKVLDARVGALRPYVESPFVIEHSEHRFADWCSRLSPWAITGIGCVVAAVVWGVWATAMDVSLERIQSAAAGQPTVAKSAMMKATRP